MQEQNGKVLIVNGDIDVRNELRKSLSSNFTVETSLTFKDALKLIRDNSYDIVIAELDIPEVKGIEVLRKLKESRSETPIIVVTTYKSVSVAVEAMKAGAYDYITKPFNADELKLAILHALNRRKLAEEAKEKKIYQELALMDGLTQIYNRRYFEELLRREAERAARYPQKFSLMMIDVDDFKKYNDAYGHVEGDKVLREMAAAILCRIRSTDCVARYGGEEFAVISPQTDKEGGSVLAARLIDVIANKEFVLDNSQKTKITISVGIATFGDDAKTKEDLVKRADEALYQAKKLGKNRMCMFGK